MKLYIWGTGKIASEYLQYGEIKQEDLLGFVETKKSKNEFWNKPVFTPQEIADTDYDYIIVCVYACEHEIYEVCKKNDVKTEKLILINNWEWINGESITEKNTSCCRKIINRNDDLSNIFPVLYQRYIKENDIQAQRYMVISRNGSDLVEPDALILKEDFSGVNYQTDYFRYRTFELVANEILNSDVQGAVAEVGVFRGAFSKMINAKFFDRTLYLFDTFDSFDKTEFGQELNLGRVPEQFYNGFKQTSDQYVLSIMPHVERCVVRKGLFPETAMGLEDEEYAFVSIDVDFELSILEGLRYFYPRLNEGGVLFIHDYNNRFLEGVKIAVKKYEEENGFRLKKIPLADEGGTLVVVK